MLKWANSVSIRKRGLFCFPFFLLLCLQLVSLYSTHTNIAKNTLIESIFQHYLSLNSYRINNLSSIHSFHPHFFYSMENLLNSCNDDVWTATTSTAAARATKDFSTKYLTRWDPQHGLSVQGSLCVCVNSTRWGKFIKTYIQVISFRNQTTTSSFLSNAENCFTLFRRGSLHFIHMATASCRDQSCPPDDLTRACVIVMRSDENRSPDAD